MSDSEMMTITAKIQLKPSSSQKVLLLETMEQYCAACNEVSAYIYQSHDLKQASVHKQVYTNIRTNYGLKSQMACSVTRTVIAKYKTIESNHHGWTQPHFHQPQLDLVWNRDYCLKQDHFSVNTLAGRESIPFFNQGMKQYFDEKYRFGTAKLICKQDKFYLYIPVTFSVERVSMSQISNVVGVDRGINFLAATYDSQGKAGFYSGRAVKQKRAKYKELRRELSKRQTPSARRRLKKIGSRENRWMQDVNHQVSKALVESNPSHTLFVLEDLSDIRKATEKVRRKDRYEAVSWAYYDLEQKLVYKAKRNDDVVIFVDPHYTSQCCPKCGHTEKANRKRHKHHFQCKKCGYQSNDDRTAAMNLHRKGVEYISSEA